MIDTLWESPRVAVNMLGHGAGVLIFGIFLALVFRHSSLQRLRDSRLSLIAAGLAFLWNLLSLAILGSGDSVGLTQRVIAGASFCVLSFLPAVLLNLCLLSRFPAIVRSGYALSSLASFAHIAELYQNSAAYHRLGLGVITIGFGLLTVISVLKVAWAGKENPRLLGSRILGTMSLFLFAISFVHFSDGQSHQAWSTELAIHHAGIPLALFVLLQDYRFVLLDAFVRFLVNGLLALIFAFGLTIALPHFHVPSQILLISLLLAAFAWVRTFLQRLITHLVFNQPDPGNTIAALRALGRKSSDQSNYLDQASQCVASFMNSHVRHITTVKELDSLDLVSPTLASELPELKWLQREGVEVVAPIRLAHGEKYYISLGERRAGRRYLSEDLEVIGRLTVCIGEQAELIRDAEIRRLVSQAELRALQSQIHPHFLFNALNTLYGIIPREASGARRMLLDLADIFRYFLRTERTYIALEEEMRIVQAYLSIEELRLGGKLRTTIQVDQTAHRELVPVLSIQPLV